jgi:formate hydrogenlyase transcriptional activator
MISSVEIHNAKVLIVDDQRANVSLLDRMLRGDGYTCVSSTMDPLEVCEMYRQHRYDLILLDLEMPGMDGFQVMAGLQEIESDGYLPVLVITAQPGHQLRALQAGAKDFVSKPFDLAEVRARVRNILEVSLLQKQLLDYNEVLESRVQERSAELTGANRRLTQEIEERKEAQESLRISYAEVQQLKERFHAENIYLKQEIDREYNFGEMIGHSKALENVFFKIEQVAPQDTTVLLLGETGTGKGAVARAIHGRSSSARKARPMITVNCAALPANLIESELFGREKGAYTGAGERQMGRFELADNGTLFLDEIGEMPLELQAKLLRAIQDGEFERLGGSRTIKVDVRIIASTNRDLDQAVASGEFRADLFYRLNVFPITIPPLRLRKEDIPLLVNYFVAKFNKKIGKKVETVSKDTLGVLQDYDWPGNVRELESIIERAVITSRGSSLQVLDRFESARKCPAQESSDAKGLAELQREHILRVLGETNWRIEGESGAAAILGLNPSTLRGRMRKEGIRRSS